ncbi:MAG: hypothetical protein H6732_09025 [Alphaproteobacteria bacterium]|nr:hypothetical protein [Alphaproteobacteria bacterium]
MSLAIPRARSALCLLVALSACGGGEAEAPAEPEAPRALNEGKPWVSPERTVEAMQAAADTRETLRYVSDGGTVDVVARFDGTARTFTFDVQQAAIRIADVPTLEYPSGWVRLDTLSITGDPERWIKPITQGVLRSLGAPLQLVFDVQSIGAFTGRLQEPGSRVEARVLGRLQVGDRAVEVSFPGVISRPGAERLEVELGAIDLALDELGLSDAVEALEDTLKVRRIDHVVQVSGRVALSQFTGDALPSFVRTPLTIQSVEEVREKLEAQVDRAEVQRLRLSRTGYDEETLDMLPRDALRRIEEARRRKAEGGPSVFEGMEIPAEKAEPAEPQRRGYYVIEQE